MFGNQKNFSKLTVSGNYSAYDTAITISGDDLAARIPNSGSGIFSLVWYDHTNYPAVYNDPNKEICRVTGFSGQTLFLQRGMEYTNNSIHSGSTHKMIATPTARGFNNLYYFRNPEKSYYMFEDFLFPHTASSEGWSRVTSSQNSNGLIGTSFTGCFGGLFINGVTGANARLTYSYGVDSYLLGSGLMILEGMMYLGSIPDTSNDFNYWLGFNDSINNASATDGALFLVNSGAMGNYTCRVANNGVRIDTITGVAITGWRKYNIVISQNADIADFYVDDILIYSSTGLLPTGASRTTAITFGYARPSNIAGQSGLAIASGSLEYISLYKEIQPQNQNYGAAGYNFRL